MSLTQFILFQLLFRNMSLVSGRSAGACLLIMFGFMAVVIGLMLVFIIPSFDPIFETISWVSLYGGILLLIIGLAMIPGVRRETIKTKSIIEIAAVRKEVTISEISQETSLDREYVREVLTKYLMSGFLFGYIEDDLFVRDTAGRPRHYGRGRMGFSSSYD